MGYGDSRRTNIGKKKKRYNEQPDRTENRLLAQREAIDAKLAVIRAAKSPATAQAKRSKHSSVGVELAQDDEAAKEQKTYGDQRVVIKFLYEHFGSPPEMMPLDAHLFADLKTAVGRHIVITAGLDLEDENRFKVGTPGDLSDTLTRVWTVVPEPHRIIEDVSRIPSTIDKIVEYRGGVVPDEVLRHGRRGERAKRPIALHPAAQAAAKELMDEVDSEVKRMRKE